MIIHRLNRPLHNVLLAVTLFSSSFAEARDWKLSSPAELKKTLKHVQPGDSLILQDGVWTNAQLVFKARGTAAQPITLRAQTPGAVILTGNSSVRLGGEWLVVSGLRFQDGACPGGHVISFRADSDEPANHSRVTDCAMVNYNSGDRAGSSFWVSLYGVSNRVDHCRFEGKNDGSPTVTVWLDGKPNHHRIDHNYFLRRPPLGRNGGETLRVGDSRTSLQDSFTVVELNRFEDCSGEAEYISNKSCANIYRFNTFVECQGALVLRHGHRCTVEGNWFLGRHQPGTGGVRVIGEDHRIVNNYFADLAGTDFESALPVVAGIPNSKLNEYFQVKRAVIAFNTFVHCRQNLTFGVGHGQRGRSEPALDCVFANNLVVGTNGPLVRMLHAPVNLVWQGNLFWGAPVGLPETPGIRVQNPQLQLPTDGIWRPGPASPALGAAVGSFLFLTQDIAGTPRGEKKDIGCFQLPAAASGRGPLAVTDVGPGWMR